MTKTNTRDLIKFLERLVYTEMDSLSLAECECGIYNLQTINNDLHSKIPGEIMDLGNN